LSAWISSPSGAVPTVRGRVSSRSASSRVTVSGDMEENRLAVRGAFLLSSGTTVVTYGP
jgi:hypothetical protein